MFKKIGKIVLVGALSFGLISGVVGADPIKVEAEVEMVIPDNHTIRELKVEWRKDLAHGYLIDVGDRKGTLLIRVDQPKIERNIEWVNWSIRQPLTVSFQMDHNINFRSEIIPF